MNGKKKFSAIFKMTCFLTYKELICMKWKTHSLNTQVYVFKPFPGNSFLWHQSAIEYLDREKVNISD